LKIITDAAHWKELFESRYKWKANILISRNRETTFYAVYFDIREAIAQKRRFDEAALPFMRTAFEEFQQNFVLHSSLG
jgi:hypothetical protein